MGRVIGQERVEVSGGWGQAGEVKVGAAEKVSLGGGRVGGDAFSLETGVDEGIDGGRRGGFGEGDEGPEGALFGGDDVGSGGWRGRAGDGFGPGGAGLNPGGEVGDFGVGEFGLLVGHGQLGVGVADGGEQEAGFGLTGDDGCAAVAAFDHRGAGVEGESGLGGECVAGEAAVGQDGADLGFEELGRVGGEERGGEGEDEDPVQDGGLLTGVNGHH